MATIQYKALDGQGRFVVGELEALDLRDASMRLEQLGYVALETHAGNSSDQSSQGKSANFSFSFSRTVSQRELTVFIRELALVLRAGLPLDEALHLLAGEERPKLSIVARRLRSAITGGAGFAEAMLKQPKVFKQDLIATVRVAEAAGNLEGVLEALADDRAKNERLVDKVSGALRYPAFLLLASVGVMIFFLLVVVPQFATVIRDFGTQPDGLVAFVLGASDFMLAEGQNLAIGLAVLLLFMFVLLRQPSVRKSLWSGIEQMPGLKTIFELRRTVLFCGGLGSLLKNGVTLTEALKVLIDLPGAGTHGLDQAVEGVRRGGRLVEALRKVGYLPPIALAMLRVGEESGELAMVSSRTAEFYEAKLTASLERFAGIIGPAAIVLIAGVVGTLIVSILSALLSVNQMVM
jgi:general secretion pathway protein F